jgi:hypothetical protein
MSTHAQDRTPAAHEGSAAQRGLVLFAGVAMLIAGVYQVLVGVGALLRDEVFVSTENYTFRFDLTSWGWTHLLLGALVAIAGVAVLRGRTWGRVVGMTLAILSMFANFMFIPYYPLWSIVIIVLDVAIIWALANFARDL